MANLPTILPGKKRVHRKRRGVQSTPTPPVNPVLITVVLAGGETADWVFDADIVSVSNISPLKIAGVSPNGVAFIENNILRVNYAIDVEVGIPWAYDGSPVATFANGGTLQPGSGVTQEG